MDQFNQTTGRKDKDQTIRSVAEEGGERVGKNAVKCMRTRYVKVGERNMQIHVQGHFCLNPLNH